MAFWNKKTKEAQPAVTKQLQNTDPTKKDFFMEISAYRSLTSWKLTDLQCLKYYLTIPELNAIINIKARAFSAMNLQIVSKGTGLPVKNYEPIVRALKYPNYFQSQKEFLMQTKLFQEIFGNEIIYFLTPIGLKNNVKGMFTLNPLDVDIEEINTTPYWLTDEFDERVKYFIDWGGKRYQLPTDEIIHINNSKVNVKADDVFWGESQIKALAGPLSNIKAAYEARNELIENRGALGILSNDATDVAGALPLDGEEKDKLQSEYQSKYGIGRDKWKLIITSLKLKWQQMAVDIDKLKLYEEVKADTEKICDAFGVKYELLANQKGSTFENQKQAEKAFYTNTIIPEAQEWVSALNRRFETMDKSWEIKCDFSHLDVFRENEKERGQSITMLISGLSKAFQDGALSIEEYKAELKKLNIGM